MIDHHAVYASRISQPYGKLYAASVGRFQEGFMQDKVCRDLDAAFIRAVEVTEKLVPAIAAKHSVTA